jgi:hypothetical protein
VETGGLLHLLASPFLSPFASCPAGSLGAACIWFALLFARMVPSASAVADSAAVAAVAAGPSTVAVAAAASAAALSPVWRDLHSVQSFDPFDSFRTSMEKGGNRMNSDRLPPVR